MCCTLPPFIPPYTATSRLYTIAIVEAHAYNLFTRKSPLSMVQDIFSRVEGGLTSLTLNIIDRDHDMWDVNARQRAEFAGFCRALGEELKAYVRSHRAGVESEERRDFMGRFADLLTFLEAIKGGKGMVVGESQVVKGMGKGEEAVH